MYIYIYTYIHTYIYIYIGSGKGLSGVNVYASPLDERKRGKHANYWDTVRRVDRSDGSRGVLAAATDIQKVLVYCLFTTIFTSLCAASIALMGLEASSLPLLIFRRWL